MMTAGNGNGNGNRDHQLDEINVGDRITPVDTTRREEGDELPRAQRFLAMPTHISLGHLDEKLDIFANLAKDNHAEALRALETFREARRGADARIYTAMREQKEAILLKLSKELDTIKLMFDAACEGNDKVRSDMADFKVEILRVLAGVGNEGAVERAEAERDKLREELRREREEATVAKATVDRMSSAAEMIVTAEREAAIDAARAKVIEARARIALYARIAAGVIVALAILGKVFL